MYRSALDFLRQDCKNITDFFRKNGKLQTMTTRELFDFITDIRIDDVDEDKYLNVMQGKIAERAGKLQTNEEKVLEKVFMQAFIPRSLAEVADYESDAKKIRAGDTEDIFYRALTGFDIKQKNLNEENEENELEEGER